MIWIKALELHRSTEMLVGPGMAALKAGIGRCIEAPVFGRDVLHAFTVCDINQVERCASDEILQASSGPKVILKNRG
jgi:hypothetical protein